MNVVVRKVMCQKDMDDFVRLPRRLYQGVKQYVPDLESEIADIVRRKNKPGMEFSNVQPFVAYQGQVPVGRIVGIINHKANERWNERVVRFGLIEFIDNQDVSRALLEAVERWGRVMDMDTIQGPLGITDFDKEGMLVEDFHLPGTMNTIWNPDYYPRHMDAHGLQKAVDWLQIRIQIPPEVPARYSRTAQYAREQIGLRVVKLSRKDLVKRGYGQRIFRLLNESYAAIFGFSSFTEQQVDDFVRKYVNLIDLRLLPVVLNDKDEMVGVAVTMRCMTEAMQKAKGRLWPTGWYYLLRALKWKCSQSAEMLLVAVRPDYQGLGVNALFFDDLIPIYNRLGIKWAETGPQLEENVRELSQWKPLKPEYVKRRRCYTKRIDN